MCARRHLYKVGVRQEFPAWHFLAGESGPEQERHAHEYRVEIILEGRELDDSGYLLDISEVQASLDALAARYRERTLNDFPEFAGINPSLEHFARIISSTLSLDRSRLTAITAKVWESESAWASCREEI